MALIDEKVALVPLSSIAELLGVKQRTLKMYEEKGLFPPKEQKDKRLYSINDIKKIAFVHYLASHRKINANGIRYINEILDEHLSSEKFDEILKKGEEAIKKSPKDDVVEENF